MPNPFDQGRRKSGLKAPTFGGSGGSGAENILLGYMLAQQKQQQAGQSAQQASASFGGNPPPGTELSATGGVKVPLNRELSSEELSAITAERVFNPTSEDIKQLTNSGVWEPEFLKGIPLVENLERTYRQWAAGQPNALLTSFDPKLQEVQGKISSLRRYVFGEGGKQLTPYEAGIVNALIKPTGKSNEQYIRDIDEALKLINEKANLAKGGELAPPLRTNVNPIPGAPGSDYRISKLNRIKDRFKQRNP